MSTVAFTADPAGAAGPVPSGIGVTPADHPAGVLATTLAVAGRTIKTFVRTPQLLVVSTVQGAMFLLIFRYVFGGAIASGPVPYVDFLVPGFVVTSVLFAGMNTSAGVAEDLEKGIADRFRSLPVPQAALVGGRVLADVALLAWSLAVTTGIGFAVGFRLHGGVLEAVAAFGLCLVFGAALTWVFVLIGLLAGNAQAAQGLSLLVFPFTFVSSAYVRVDTMPGWLQPLAEHQPVTYAVDAVRSLALGDPALAGLDGSTAHYVVLTLVWCAGIAAVCAPLAVARYRRS